jgi:very-short-patch-repair endonuclease
VVVPRQSERFDALLRRQSGVVSRAQARDAWSAWQVRKRLADGVWHSLYGGRALTPAGTLLTARSYDVAALLACGRDAVLAGPSAARALGSPVSFGAPAIAVPPQHRREPSGILVLRETVPQDDLVVVDGVRTTGWARTVVDCLRLLPESQGRTHLDRWLQEGWITFDELVHRTQQMVGRRGVPHLRRHLRTASVGVRSEGERRLVALLRGARVRGWIPDYPVAGVGRIDIAFPDLKLAIEVDGRAWHVADDRFQRDRSRQNELVRRGWTVLRFTWADLVTRPQHVVLTITATLAALAAA